MSTKEHKSDHVKHIWYIKEDKLHIPIRPNHSTVSNPKEEWLRASCQAERKWSESTLTSTYIFRNGMEVVKTA